ncbi:MAG: hypothetical protein HC819_12515 [Cyclobacteriaceae bacterium]|nr:hypothetical protein [Cyclobacteriaceae bacterium]
MDTLKHFLFPFYQIPGVQWSIFSSERTAAPSDKACLLPLLFPFFSITLTPGNATLIMLNVEGAVVRPWCFLC